MVGLDIEFLRQANQAVRQLCYEWSGMMPKSEPKTHKRKRTKWKNRGKK